MTGTHLTAAQQDKIRALRADGRSQRECAAAAGASLAAVNRFITGAAVGGGPRRLVWADVLAHAAAIVESYRPAGVTLRQLFYRLVADGTLPNLKHYYTELGAHTAKARRAGTFPALTDRTRAIERYESFASPAAAVARMRAAYRRDRTEGQAVTIVLGVEKAGMSEQLASWFTGPLGVPHVALGGYASQPLCSQVRSYVAELGRPAVLIYAGDCDPTGEDIDRDFAARTSCWDEVNRIALSREQVQRYGLPASIDPEVAAKLERDPRAGAFAARHGDLAQHELDALPPDELRRLYQEAVSRYWDDGAYQAVMERERAERAVLDRLEVAR